MGFFGKIFLTVLVILGALLAWRWVAGTKTGGTRADAGLGRVEEPPARRRTPFWRRGGDAATAAPAKVKVEDMAACAVCGAFVARGAGKCGRADCPQT